MLKMMWMAKTKLILQFNGIYRINGFVMENSGLMKFTMAYMELPPIFSTSKASSNTSIAPNHLCCCWN
jgi:hypothetical protein